MIRKKIYIGICSVFLSVISFPCHTNGQTIFTAIKGAFDNSSEENKPKHPENIYELTLDENIENPSVGKYAEQIVAFQKEQAKSIKREKYKTELMREGEVIVVTIPAENLFLPNDTVLNESASVYLRPFLKFLKTPDLYRVLLAMHTDNTGTDSYTYNLSRARVESVFEWFDDKNVNTDFVIPYALGGSEPMLPNNSAMNRHNNRRLEIFLVPGKAMIDKAKKGTIAL